MTTGKDKDLVEFEENPYAFETKSAEDIVRIFYINNLPILPVISKRGILLGVLKKNDLISELSDIKRGELKIDKLITRLAKKVSFDDLLPFGNIKEFVVINIFGEIQGKWNRIQLFSAAENIKIAEKQNTEKDIETHAEEQVLDWMIYLILEHIPRALYALNGSGKTIFYNSYFEDIYEDKFDSTVDSEFVEISLLDIDKNEPVVTNSGVATFLNSDFNLNYEKLPLISKGEKVGFLIYFPDNQINNLNENFTVEIEDGTLSENMEIVEREIIVDALKKNDDFDIISNKLGISKQFLVNKMEKYNITH